MTAPVSPVLGALAVVVRGSEVLLVKRKNPPDQGLWGYPGGRVELGETVTQAALRELTEETSVHARAGETLGAKDIILHDENGHLTHHIYLVGIHCWYGSGEPHAADDAEEASWVTIEDVMQKRLAMSLGVDTLLTRALNRIGPEAPGG